MVTKTKTKRRLALLLALALATAAQAQGTRYDSGHKYGLLSNLEIGVGGVYSYDITNAAHRKNAGAQLLVTKRIGDRWRLRGVAEANGFAANGFDRLGKGMLGVSLDLLPFYLYADYGASLNPSAKSRLGLAMDAGAGLQLKVGNAASLYVEGGVDRTNSGDKWQSNAEVKAGVLVSTGVTERDRVNKSIADNMRAEYGELKGENRLLKTEAQKMQAANEAMQATLTEAASLLDALKAQLEACRQQPQATASLPPILFDYASADITPAMDDYLADFAELINADTHDYLIEGYCSANGDGWRNQILSEDRAWAVYHRLVGYGVSEHRLYVEGKGMAPLDRPSEQKVLVRRKP